MNLKERARSIARRIGGKEATNLICRTAIYLSRTALFGELHYATVEIALIVVSKDNIDTLDSSYIVRLELRITPCNSDNCVGVTTMYLTYDITTLLIGMLRYGAAIYNGNIRWLRRLYPDKSPLLKLASQGRRLGKVEFTTQRMKTYTLLRHSKTIK